MVSRNTMGLLTGLFLAANDVSMMGIMKHISQGVMAKVWMVLVSIVYAIQPWIFLKGLDFSSMTVLNLSWDLISDILVTLSGLWYFREQVTETKLIGVLFSLVAIVLFSLDGEDS